MVEVMEVNGVSGWYTLLSGVMAQWKRSKKAYVGQVTNCGVLFVNSLGTPLSKKEKTNPPPLDLALHRRRARTWCVGLLGQALRPWRLALLRLLLTRTGGEEQGDVRRERRVVKGRRAVGGGWPSRGCSGVDVAQWWRSISRMWPSTSTGVSLTPARAHVLKRVVSIAQPPRWRTPGDSQMGLLAWMRRTWCLEEQHTDNEIENGYKTRRCNV